MATSDALREVFTVARPLVEQWLDVAEQIAALREVATAKGLDWSQLKALLKAQIQDERDDDGSGKRVARIVEKAEFASAYADMLGLANMNENNFSREEFRPKGEAKSEPGVLPGGNLLAAREPDESAAPFPPSSAPTSSPAETKATGTTPLVPVATPFKLRPHCRHPANCAGYGSNHCHSCKVASATLQHGALA